MPIQEVLIDWSAENARPGLSVMYFKSTANIVNVRAAIDVMFTAVADRLDSLTSGTVRTAGKILDETTGTLTGFWNDPTATTWVGTVVGQPVSNADQALMRWRTNNVVAGRLLQGRTFIPGLAQGAMDGGHLSAATIADFQVAQAAFLASIPADMVIWHRPLGVTPGSFFAVDSGATWNELAVQRRRR